MKNELHIIHNKRKANLITLRCHFWTFSLEIFKHSTQNYFSDTVKETSILIHCKWQ